MTYGCLICNTLADEKLQKRPEFEKNQVHACWECHNLYCNDHWEGHVFYYHHREGIVQ